MGQQDSADIIASYFTKQAQEWQALAFFIKSLPESSCAIQRLRLCIREGEFRPQSGVLAMLRPRVPIASTETRAILDDLAVGVVE